MKKYFLPIIILALFVITCEDSDKNHGDIGKKGPGGGIIFFSEGGQFKECSGELGKSTWDAAVTTAKNYKGGGYNDWSLPSRSELDLMYKNLKKKDIGGLSNDRYWSSDSVGNGSYAWFFNFSYGTEDSASKTSSYGVRAVRSYTKDPEHKTKLTIKNDSFTEIAEVKWNNITFPASAEQNSIKSGSSVTKNVEAGSGYIFFKRAVDPINARTRDLIAVEKDKTFEFTFTDYTVIVDTDNLSNTGTLQGLQPVQTKLTVKNESLTEVTNVIWQGVSFANNQYDNSIKPGTTVTKIVQPGGGYFFFKRKTNPVSARTADIFVVEKYDNKEFVFRDNTNIIEVNNSDNIGTLGSLQSTVIFWDDAEGDLQPYFESISYVGYYSGSANLPYIITGYNSGNNFHAPKNGTKSIAVGGSLNAKLHIKINLEKKAKISFWYANRAGGSAAGTVFSINEAEERKWTVNVNWSFMEYELSSGVNDIIWQKNDGIASNNTFYLSLDDILIRYME